MYANPLSPLVPSPYPPYMWHPLPGLFLPYSPAQRPESLSPDRATSLDQSCAPEKAKIGKCYENVLRVFKTYFTLFYLGFDVIF